MHRVRLDGNAALALEVHVVEDLVLHLLGSEGFGVLEKAIGKGGFAVIDMGDNAEVARKKLLARICHENCWFKACRVQVSPCGAAG